MLQSRIRSAVIAARVVLTGVTPGQGKRLSNNFETIGDTMFKKTIFALCAVLAATSPAAAQFKGLGEKLFDKAKDEVESAISKELDDPQKEDTAQSEDSTAPASANEPAPPECHEVSNVNYFTHDLTQFTYCSNSISEVQLSVQAMTGAPAPFQNFTPEHIGAEIRLEGQSVSATPDGKRPQKDPRDPARHILTIKSPADAMKVASAINAGQSFDIVLKGPAGEEFLAFSGMFEVKFPQGVVVGNASDTDDVKISAMSQSGQQPEPKKIGYADPLGEACSRDGTLSGLYDCGCVDDKAMKIRQSLSDRQFAEAKEKWVPYRENQLRLAEERLAKETDPKRIENMERSIARAKDELEKLKTRPDPMSHSVSAVSMDAYKGASCKIGDYFREKEKKDCLASVSLMSGVGDPEAYCACSADKAAELWLQSDKAFGSSVFVQTVTQARQACRG